MSALPIRLARHAVTLSLVFLFLAALSGCSAEPKLETVPVGGKVTYDGKPVTEGTIIFTSEKGYVGTAKLKDDGSYQIVTTDGNGLPPGKYRIAVSPPPPEGDVVAADGSMKSAAPKDYSNIPPSRRDTATSKLTADVAAGKATYDFELK